MKVAILGTGMPALVAAHAAFKITDCDELVLYGPNEKQKPYGARFYEREIPGLTGPDSLMCHVQANGEAEAYTKKLGAPMTRYTRPRPDFLAFDYHDAYEILWDAWSECIIPMRTDKAMINESYWDDCDYVISTLPRPEWYEPQDYSHFAATRHWRLDECHEEVRSPYVLPEKNIHKQIMVFDGGEDSSWFRITQLFGLMSVEWPFHKKPPISGVFLEILPIGVSKEFGLKQVIPAWRGTRALIHAGPLARWAPSTDIADVFWHVSDGLSGKEIGNDLDRGGRD